MPTRRQVLSALTAAAMAVCVLVPLHSGGARAQPADDFIRSMGQQAIDSLTGAELSNEQREARFRRILNRSFDMATIARFTLGRYWRVATEEQRAEYVRLFEDFVVRAYAARFREYSGESFKVGQVCDASQIKLRS